MNLKTNIMENTNNSKPYNQVTEALWEFIRRLSVSNVVHSSILTIAESHYSKNLI